MVIDLAARAQVRWGVILERRGQEWHGPCPVCGGHDRFWVNTREHYQCRRCGFSGWLDDGLSPTALAARQAEVVRAEAAQQADLAYRLNALRRQVEREADLLSHDEERKLIAEQYYRGEGISDWAIQYYQLGFTRHHTVRGGGGDYLDVPAFTIPVWEPHEWQVVNIQYRLADPPPGVGKYQQVAGLPAAAFYCQGRTTGDALVVEGAKKALVLYQLCGGELQVVGLPGNFPSERVLTGLHGFERLYLMLDPNSDDAVERIARELYPRVRIVSLCAKPDDLVRQGMSRADLRAHLTCARLSGG